MAFALEAGMHLPGHVFSEIVQALQVEAACDRGQDRRTARRIEVMTTVQLAHCPNGIPDDEITALTRDICVGGIGLLQSAPAEPDQRLLVRLPRLCHPPIVLLGRIAYCRRVADGIHNVGVSFLREFQVPAGDVAAQRDELEKIRRQILS